MGLRDALTASGTEVEVNLTVDGRDIAVELPESSCRSEGCTDGCGESIACRVWVHEGREHIQAPVAMVVDTILREVYGGPVVEDEPDLAPHGAETSLDAQCCSATEQQSCCAAEDKPECCGATAGESCGCR